MNLSCVKYFLLKGSPRHPDMMTEKEFHTWPHLSELCGMLCSDKSAAVVTDQVSGLNTQKHLCYIVYVDKIVMDTDRYVVKGFVPIQDNSLFIGK